MEPFFKTCLHFLTQTNLKTIAHCFWVVVSLWTNIRNIPMCNRLVIWLTGEVLDTEYCMDIINESHHRTNAERWEEIWVFVCPGNVSSSVCLFAGWHSGFSYHPASWRSYSRFRSVHSYVLGITLRLIPFHPLRPVYFKYMHLDIRTAAWKGDTFTLNWLRRCIQTFDSIYIVYTVHNNKNCNKNSEYGHSGKMHFFTGKWLIWSRRFNSSWGNNYFC